MCQTAMAESHANLCSDLDDMKLYLNQASSRGLPILQFSTGATGHRRTPMAHARTCAAWDHISCRPENVLCSFLTS